ncbi:MAG: tetratricopeptide repeat protein [SAR202 cluster bacterium]|nr:tetratricopeptide repeat protein [SAR202 cluster bacterium]
MTSQQAELKAKLRKDRCKKAVAFAMQGRWADAAAENQAILADFPDDSEALNRMGKAYTELGRIKDAKDAFNKGLELSPHNAIAKKNLDRLNQLGDEVARPVTTGKKAPDIFIEESGKSGVTALMNLANGKSLLKLSPGDPINLKVEGSRIMAEVTGGEYVGQVEPKIASRLLRLTKGGNKYEATITSAGEHEAHIIIRETYKHPSQANIVSFPGKGGAGDLRVYVPGAILGYEMAEQDDDADEPENLDVKDWSNDDTEPGDDEAFSPVIHRIINANNEEAEPEDQEY